MRVLGVNEAGPGVFSTTVMARTSFDRKYNTRRMLCIVGRLQQDHIDPIHFPLLTGHVISQGHRTWPGMASTGCGCQCWFIQVYCFAHALIATCQLWAWWHSTIK